MENQILNLMNLHLSIIMTTLRFWSSIIIEITESSLPFSKRVSGELTTVPENIGFSNNNNIL